MASYLYTAMAVIGGLGVVAAALGYRAMVGTAPSTYLKHLEACVLGLLIASLVAFYFAISIGP